MSDGAAIVVAVLVLGAGGTVAYFALRKKTPVAAGTGQPGTSTSTNTRGTSSPQDQLASTVRTVGNIISQGAGIIGSIAGLFGHGPTTSPASAPSPDSAFGATTYDYSKPSTRASLRAA